MNPIDIITQILVPGTQVFCIDGTVNIAHGDQVICLHVTEVTITSMTKPVTSTTIVTDDCDADCDADMDPCSPGPVYSPYTEPEPENCHEPEPRLYQSEEEAEYYASSYEDCAYVYEPELPTDARPESPLYWAESPAYAQVPQEHYEPAFPTGPCPGSPTGYVNEPGTESDYEPEPASDYEPEPAAESDYEPDAASDNESEEPTGDESDGSSKRGRDCDWYESLQKRHCHSRQSEDGYSQVSPRDLEALESDAATGSGNDSECADSFFSRLPPLNNEW